MKKLRSLTPLALLFCWLGFAALGRAETVSESSLTLADRLEKAIYLQEAESDLDDAAKAYLAILSEADVVSSLAAEAKYRLAMCYMDQGKRELALMTLSKLVAEYPNEARWVEAAKEVLPKEFTPELTPWSDGDRLQYRWSLTSGMDLGYSYTVYRKLQEGGRAQWQVESRVLLNGDRDTVVEFDAETFQSVSSKIEMPEVGTIQCHYGENSMSADIEYEKSGQHKTFDFENHVYDNEQTLSLMRQFPLEKGYSTEMSLFVTLSGVAVPVRFEVADILPMKTVLGEVNCYRVNIVLAGSQQTYYYTADERRILVRIEMGGVVSELVKVDRYREGVESTFTDDEAGLSIQHLDTWVAFRVPGRSGTTEANIYFMAPFQTGIFSLYTDKNAKFSDKSVLADIDTFTQFIIDDEAPRRAGQFEYAGIWKDAFEINGMPAKAYRLHRDAGEKGPEMDRYTFVVLGHERHFIIHAFLTPEQAKENLDAFVRLASSLHE